MELLAPDLEAEPTVSQPKSVVYGQMRNYQLKGLEVVLAIHSDGNSDFL